MMNESKEISGCPMHHAGKSDDKPPIILRQMGKSKTDGSDNAYAVPSRRPWPHRKASQAIQIRALTKPNGLCAKIVKSWFRVGQVHPGNQFKKRLTFGQNFCYAFSVVLSEWDEVVNILSVTPQARTFRLGTASLAKDRLDGSKDGGRNLWLLSLSQEGAGGDGMHEAVREAFGQRLIVGALERQKDSTAKKIMADMVKDYEDTLGKGTTFFTDRKRGMLPFFIKYLHYCMFGISPSDHEKLDVLFSFYYDSIGTIAATYYLKGFNKVLNVFEKNAYKKLLPQVIKIYENTPALKDLNTITSKNITRNELAQAVIPLMSIAATVGPRHLLRVAMGADKFTKQIPGAKTDKIDILHIWDNLDLKDRSEVERFLYEVGRLNTPVKNSHHVATEEFTVKMLGKDRTFPAGTVILIPFALAMTDKNIWGENAHDFDHNRPNLIENSMIFNSVGNKTNNRICPGKSLAMNMAIEMIIECGKVRKRHFFHVVK